jgi:hypothetical protein
VSQTLTFTEDINRKIARLLTPAFRGLSRQQKPRYRELAEELHAVRKQLASKVAASIDNAASDLRSIEEAKKLWVSRLSYSRSTSRHHQFTIANWKLLGSTTEPPKQRKVLETRLTLSCFRLPKA